MNLNNTLKQYGIAGFLKKVVQKIINRVYFSENFIVLGFNKIDTAEEPSKQINLIDNSYLHGSPDLNSSEKKMFENFLSDGDIGITYKVKDKTAGYAWTQYKNNYYFGRYALLDLPSGFCIYKNLFVHPDFRGKSIGKYLNLARLNMLKPDTSPLVIIINDNHYAIRNWKQAGAKPILQVITSKHCFCKKPGLKIVAYQKNRLCEKIRENIRIRP